MSENIHHKSVGHAVLLHRNQIWLKDLIWRTIKRHGSWIRTNQLKTIQYAIVHLEIIFASYNNNILLQTAA